MPDNHEKLGNQSMTHGKRFGLLASGVILALFGTCVFAVENAPKKEGGGKLEGTWERNLEGAPWYRAVKIVSGTHFMFAVYERKSGRAVMVGGGTCSLDGTTYKEKVEFGNDSPGPLELVGKEQAFTATLKDDEWLHEGTLSNGAKIKEVWKRVK